VTKLLRSLMAYLRGEPKVWSVVRVRTIIRSSVVRIHPAAPVKSKTYDDHPTILARCLPKMSTGKSTGGAREPVAPHNY
jgi:hypothetical protein